jgi:hypothetical protein
MSNTVYVTGGKPIAVWSQSISGVSDVNPEVAFYDFHGRNRGVLLFYFVPVTTRDFFKRKFLNSTNNKNIIERYAIIINILVWTQSQKNYNTFYICITVEKPLSLFQAFPQKTLKHVIIST